MILSIPGRPIGCVIRSPFQSSCGTPRSWDCCPGYPVFYEVYATATHWRNIGDGRLSANADNRRILTFPSSYAPDGWLVLVLRAYPSGSLIGGTAPIFLTSWRRGSHPDHHGRRYAGLSPLQCHALSMLGSSAALACLPAPVSVNTRCGYFWLGSSLAIVALLRVDEISRIVNIDCRSG